MKHKIKIMITPSTDKPARHLKINTSVALTMLVALVIVNVSFLINTFYSKNVSDTLSHENTVLSENLMMTQDKIDRLEDINANKTDEIAKLKLSIKTSNDFLVDRLLEMEQTQKYVSQLVVLFNDETTSSVEMPISRSFNRLTQASETAAASDTSEIVIVSPDEKLLSEMDALIATDEISLIINEQSNAYKDLVDTLTKQISYLESRPDFYPTNGTFSSPFGYRSDPITGISTLHSGIDISNQVGTAIYAAGSGIVTYSGYDGNFGNVLIIDHGHGYETAYAHCKTLLYAPGDEVSKGEQVAIMGATGRTTGPHLHFEIRYNKTPINPLKIIQK